MLLESTSDGEKTLHSQSFVQHHEEVWYRGKVLLVRNVWIGQELVRYQAVFNNGSVRFAHRRVFATLP